MATRFGASGEDHPNWKGGIQADFYRRRAFAAYGEACNRCSDTGRLHVHHRDGNRRNSDVENLEVLCHACHMKEHHGRRVLWTCPECSKSIEIRPYEAKSRKYCSNKCRMSSRTRTGTFGSVRKTNGKV